MAVRGQSMEALRTEIGKGNIPPLYFFFGEEEFLLSEAVDLVVSTALKDAEKGFNLDVFEGTEIDAPSLIACASTFPMMSERRVVVVRQIDKISGGDKLISYFEAPTPTTVHVLLSSKPDFRRKLILVLKDHAFAVEFKKLYENQVPAWIESRAEIQGHRIDGNAARLLAEYAGTSLREIQNELEKLYTYAGNRQSISVEDVQAVSGISKEFNVFELQKAMGLKDRKRSMEILDRMLDQGEAPTRILWMIGRYYIAVRKLSELRKRGTAPQEQAAVLGTKPFWLRDYLPALEHYTDTELEDAFLAIALADEQLKSTPLEAKQVLQCMTATLT